MNMKDKTKLFNIPNCLCYFRILLIPVFLFVYFNAQWQHHYIIAAFILVLSGISDCLDGYIARKYNLNYSAEDEIMVTVGGSEAIDVALRCMVDPGDEVLIPQPCYVSYVPCAVMADAKPVAIELKAENEFKLTKEELIASITDKTKILILAYPNNPTGAIMTKEELAELVPVIIDNDLYVISDEIYSELTYGSRHCSIASFPGMKERTVVINGFSKAFAMTGWRLGYAWSTPHAVALFDVKFLVKFVEVAHDNIGTPFSRSVDIHAGQHLHVFFTRLHTPNRRKVNKEFTN